MVLDTNILIAYLNGETTIVQAISNWKKEDRALIISSVSVAEVLALPNLSIEDTRRVKYFLKNFISVPFDDKLAETTATIKRLYHLKIPDAAIAATAIDYLVPLVSRDKQFVKMRELTVVSI